MTERTALAHIDGLRLMLQGTTYTQVLGMPAIRYYLTRISADYGPQQLRNAVTSIRGHVTYAQGKMGTTGMNLSLLADEFDAHEPVTQEEYHPNFKPQAGQPKILCCDFLALARFHGAY